MDHIKKCRIITRQITPLLLIALVSIAVTSCGSSNSGTKKEQKSYGLTLPVKSVFNATRVKGGSIKFDFTYQIPHDTANADFKILFFLTGCYCVINDTRYGVLDTIDIHPATGVTTLGTNQPGCRSMSHALSASIGPGGIPPIPRGSAIASSIPGSRVGVAVVSYRVSIIGAAPGHYLE